MNVLTHLTLAIGLLTLACAHSATLTVGPGEKLTSIGQALEHAQAGDVIEIREGVYVEHFTVPGVGVERKPLTIRAAPGERVVVDTVVLGTVSTWCRDPLVFTRNV